ncbi:uncharacterized protein B0J16DRAFT_393611 [Fusarium flagelliforme]|uniref:uncharacterized protein n=1 Tax=Fusarium flagelliforme TaxID=2675880 RepID=UPI001E8E6B55|nr:uncharacterized protein B0J16DRAFT_393611 [Fusarium flagelliforme]KAH7168157.1 hypothetical protein B0J16DRAFT_393611 [Fusarium flagelliforme]
MSPTGRKRSKVPASAVTMQFTKRVRLPNHAGNSSSTSRPQPGRLGSHTRHALDDRGTAALRRDRGSTLFVADDPDVSVASPNQSLRRKTLSSGQDPDADTHSSLPSSFLPDSTSLAISSTETAGLLTQHTLPSSEAPDEQHPIDLPKTLSRYERKLKKFVSQWHASLVEKGIPEHLAYELAKHCVQANDGENDSETDSHHVSRVKKPLFPPLPGALLGGTQVFPNAPNTYQDDIEDGGITSRPSTNLVPTQASQPNDEPSCRCPEASRKDFGGRLSSQEICVIGITVLYEVFGSRGQKRLADALTHLYGRHPRRHLAEIDRNAGRVADEIRKDGPATLSSFTLRWAQAVQHDSPNMLRSTTFD